MNQIDIQWSNPLLLHLKLVTRELKFDWAAISANVRSFAMEQNLNNDVAFITAATCREMFATDYSVEVVVPSVANQLEILEASNSKDASKTDKVNANMEKMLKDYENMSLEDLIAHVEYTEENMKQRREKIFDRVLSSLGGDNVSSTAAVTSVDMDLTRQAYNENLANKQLERQKRQLLIEEQAEKVRLDLERENLRKRFETGSADREGEDPLSSHAESGLTGMNSASKYGDSGGLRMGEKKSAELDFIDSLPYDPSVTQALESYMETDEFETMLTELEREIEAMAPAKIEGEEPSELSEILKVLEVAAASNAAIASTKRPSSVHIAEPPVPPTQLSAPVSAVETVETAAVAPPSRGTPSTATSKLVKNPADVTSAAPNTVPTVPRTVAEGSRDREQSREYQYARSRHPAPAARSGGAGIEQKGGVSDDEESAGGSGLGSSDSEEDWRAMRNRQKRTAGKAVSRSARTVHSDDEEYNQSAPSHVTVEIDRGGRREGTGFWGAYGAPTAGLRDAGLPPALHQEAPSDARINPLVEEFVASLPKDRFVEDESESEGEGGTLEGPIRAVQDAAMSASAAEAEVSRMTSSTVPSTPSSEETLPSPPRPVTVAVEQLQPPTPPTLTQPPLSPPKPLSASLAPPAVPVVSGSLATAAPLSVPIASAVSASGGLLGASTGAARRTKGKVGSIMGAARPRKSPLETSTGTVEPAGGVSADAVAVAATTATTPSEPTATPAPESTPATETSVSAVEEEPTAATDIPAGPSASELRVLEIKAASVLDTLTAPVLSPLPYAYISNKSSGSVVEFSTSTLPARLASAGCSVERIVLVDVDVCAVAEKCSGDVVMGAVLAWLLGAIAGKYGLVALQWGTIQQGSAQGEQSVCRIALETVSEAITQAELVQIAQTTPLASIVPPACDSAIDASITVLELLSIRDSFSAPLLSDLDFFRLPMHNAALLQGVCADDASPLLVSARDIAVCTLKSHVLTQPSPDGGEDRRGVLVDLLQECARGGLRLCGMRLVHLNALELFELEPYCSIPAYTRPVAPVEGAPHSALRYDQHVLPVLCLAFHASNNGCSKPETSVAAFHSSHSRSSTSVTNTAATVLRSVLGPEDPALARKTDPASLRAVYGTSKESNLAYHVPHSVDRLLKETTFWFGGRSEELLSAVSASASKSLAMLSVHSPRTVTLRCVLSSSRDALTAASGGQLSAAQSTVLAGVVELLDSSGELLSFSSTSIPFTNTTATTTDVVVNDTETCEPVSSVSNAVSAQCLVWRYRSHAGDAYLTHSAEKLRERVAVSPAAAGWSAQFDFSCSSSAPSDQSALPAGSRLLALEMLKKVQEDDCKSHEDVGLSDVVVLTIGSYSTAQQTSAEGVSTKDTHNNTASAQVMPVLQGILSFLPKTCAATILTVRSVDRASGLAVGLRGYQIIENIDYAVAEMQRVYSGNTGSSNPAGSRAKADGRVAQAADSTTLTMSVKVLKGKKALEVLFAEFPLESMYLDLALRELYTYVPLPGLLRTGLSWQDTASAVAEAALQTGSTATVVGAALSLSPTQILQAFYPPGVFTAMGAVLVPWLSDAVAMTRNLAKLCVRLEKDGFALVELKAVPAVSQQLLTRLYEENLAEYTGVGHVCSAAATLAKSEVTQMLQQTAKNSFVAVLVRRRSALLKLKSAIGPVFSTELAEAHYPRSVACLLHSLSVPSSSSTSSRTVAQKHHVDKSTSAPLLLPTLSCASAQAVLQELFPHFHVSYDAQQAALSLNHSAQELHATDNDSALVEHLTECTEGSGVVAGQPLRIPLTARLNKSEETSSTAELQLKTDTATEATSASVLPGVLAKHVDIAGVVVTRALLQELCVGALLEALHREGLVVRNMYTTFLVPVAAKQLLQLAGASSLSMKPALQLLTSAPVLVLGLEGPAHAFVRFKSFPVVARSPALLWKLNAPVLGASATASTTAVLSSEGAEGSEWGVVASSSSRLAKDLYKHCFDALHGTDSAFTYYTAM